MALSEVEELSRKGKARRFRPGRTPDFRKLSNVLRTIGLYLESKQAKLIELQVRPLTITLSYKDSDGLQQVEDRTIHSFHSVFLDSLREARRKPKTARRLSSPVKFLQGFVEIALVDEFGNVGRWTLDPTLLGVNADVVFHPF